MVMLAMGLALLRGAVGAFWRRTLGGYLGKSRALLMGLSPLLVGPEAFFILPWWQATVITLLSCAHWPDGHRFDRPWKLLGRYSYAALPIAILLALWHSPMGVIVALTGPLVAAGYAVARMVKPDPMDSFLDGWSSWGELVLGASLPALVTFALLY